MRRDQQCFDIYRRLDKKQNLGGLLYFEQKISHFKIR